MLFFDETRGAAAALADLRGRAVAGWSWLEEVAVIERHHSGRVATHLTHASVTEGTAVGVLTGAVVGLLFPPVSLGALAVLAGTAGGGVEKLRKGTELPAALVDEVRRGLGRGTSALVLVGEPDDLAELEAAAATLQPSRTLREPLPEPVVDDLTPRLA